MAWSFQTLVKGLMPGAGGVSATGLPIQYGIGRSVEHGTSSGEADNAVPRAIAIGAGSDTDIDLKSFTAGGPMEKLVGNAVDWSEIAYISIEADAANPDTITITPGATNGFTGLIGGTGEVVLAPGESLIVMGQRTVGASNKVINIANDDGSAAASVRMLVVGR